MSRQITKQDFLKIVENELNAAHDDLYSSPAPGILTKTYLELMVNVTFHAVSKCLHKGMAVHMPQVGTLEVKKQVGTAKKKLRFRGKEQSRLRPAKAFR